jgi:hypothetical protein
MRFRGFESARIARNRPSKALRLIFGTEPIILTDVHVDLKASRPSNDDPNGRRFHE